MGDFLIPHEWAREEDGSIEDFDLGDYHGGPKCLRCDAYFCKHCTPDVLWSPCSNQTDELVAPPFTEVQMDVRLRQLKQQGYILRGGIIVGKGDPVVPCKKDEHKWTVAERRSTGEGIYRRVFIKKRCVVCSTTTIGP